MDRVARVIKFIGGGQNKGSSHLKREGIVWWFFADKINFDIYWPAYCLKCFFLPGQIIPC
jgi:hypothetical protein